MCESVRESVRVRESERVKASERREGVQWNPPDQPELERDEVNEAMERKRVRNEEGESESDRTRVVRQGPSRHHSTGMSAWRETF